MQIFMRRPAVLIFSMALFFATVPRSAPAAPVRSTGLGELSASLGSAGNESLTSGLALIAKGDLAGAEKALNTSIKLDPALAEAFLALADIRLRQGNLQGAEIFARRAMAIRPDAPNSLVALGNVLLLGKKGVQAEELYRKALAIDKDHVSAYMGLGELYLTVLKQPTEAIVAYRHAATLSPRLAPAHFALGTAYATAKAPGKAIAAFQEAAKLAPDDPQPFHVIGRLQASEKNLDLAVLSLSAALAANPAYLPALIDRADALAELERNGEALADYETIVRKRPDDAQLWLKLGLVNERLQRRSDAVKAYQKALNLNPSLPLAYNNLAWMAMQEKSNLEQALAWATKATQLARNVPQFHDTLGWIHHARGELDLARKSLETAAKIAPPQADVYYHLGVVLQEQGKKKEAAAALNQALQIDKRFANAADANKRLGELSK